MSRHVTASLPPRIAGATGVTSAWLKKIPLSIIVPVCIAMGALPSLTFGMTENIAIANFGVLHADAHGLRWASKRLQVEEGPRKQTDIERGRKEIRNELESVYEKTIRSLVDGAGGHISDSMLRNFTKQTQELAKEKAVKRANR